MTRAALCAMVLSACSERGAPRVGDTVMLPAPAVAETQPTAGAPTAGETSTLPHGSPAEAGNFRLAGNEPFWAVRIAASGVTYTTPDYRNGIRFPSTAPERMGTTLRWVALTPPPEAHTLEVTLEERPCQDSMADKTWSHTATVVFDGTTTHGCGERVAR